MPKMTASERFWSKVDKSGDCWIWRAGKHRDGYGLTHVSRKTILAHRLVWQMTNGEIEKGLCVLHKCDNPPCVNPDHLFLGTHTDNMRDAVNKGRCKVPGLSGGKHPFAKLSETDILHIRDLSKIMTHVKIASLYGVARQTIGDIISGRNWRNV